MIFHYIAQSGFLITTKQKKVIAIDLWLNNPLIPLKLEEIPKTDYVFCTHDHQDHDLKSAIELAKRDESMFISSYGIMKYAQEQGVKNIAPGNIGGFYSVDDYMSVKHTNAFHTSDRSIPVGFIIEIEDVVIY